MIVYYHGQCNNCNNMFQTSYSYQFVFNCYNHELYVYDYCSNIIRILQVVELFRISKIRVKTN